MWMCYIDSTAVDQIERPRQERRVEVVDQQKTVAVVQSWQGSCSVAGLHLKSCLLWAG